MGKKKSIKDIGLIFDEEMARTSFNGWYLFLCGFMLEVLGFPKDVKVRTKNLKLYQTLLGWQMALIFLSQKNASFIRSSLKRQRQMLLLPLKVQERQAGRI